jgi:lantibiotic modifying enzyme
MHSPGFFQGAAGIGYELLRLVHPDQFPSALLWE